MKEELYKLENLTCAYCASKIEERIAQLDGVQRANFVLGTQQLRILPIVDADDKAQVESTQSQQADSQTGLREDGRIRAIQAICDEIEPGVVVHKWQETVKEMPLASTDERFEEWFTWGLLAVGGIVLFVYALTDWLDSSVGTAIFLGLYVLLGKQIFQNSWRNIRRGEIFDENFLMCIATLGAIALGDLAEAVGVLLFYRLGEYIEEKASAKSRAAVMSVVDLRPETVRLQQGDEIIEIPAETAKVGDYLEIRVGDRIPLDGRVRKGSTQVDTSAVTGEPVPRQVDVNDEILSGCVNVGGVITLEVEKVLADSMVSRILEAVEVAAANKPHMDRFITRFARIYTPIVVAIAALTAIVPSVVTGDWSYWIYTALTFLVISCPCALVLSVPLAFFSGIGASSKRGILFKGGESLEAINRIKALALDKTGTLTTGVFAVQSVEGKNQSMKGNLQSIEPDSEIGTDATQSAAYMDEEKIVQLAASLERSSTHPIAQSIVKAAQSSSLYQAESVKEWAGEGLSGIITSEWRKQDVLCGNRRLLERFAISIPDLEPLRMGSEVLVAVAGHYVGRICVADTIKEEAATAIDKLRSQGLHLVMLTGDHSDSANEIANVLGIDSVEANLVPDQKLSVLERIRSTQGAVMFVGDGINDAPVLAGADVSGAMGTGADAAIETADVVFMRPTVTAIAQSLDIGRATMSVAWQNVWLAIGLKVLIMILGLIGYASLWLAVFADTGVTVLCILNSIRLLYMKFD